MTRYAPFVSYISHVVGGRRTCGMYKPSGHNMHRALVSNVLGLVLSGSGHTTHKTQQSIAKGDI